jgi:hypothetical protein
MSRRNRLTAARSRFHDTDRRSATTRNDNAGDGRSALRRQHSDSEGHHLGPPFGEAAVWLEVDDGRVYRRLP